jgi:radical SAM superfamily enzyme YgiQ (UPF0313 family)
MEYMRRLDPPLFLLQLAPVLQEEGFSVRVNDLNGVSQDQWGFGHCLLYIIYADYRGYELASEIARYCKHTNDKSIVVACGSGPSKSMNKYIDNTDFNVIIRGEPEAAIVKFIRSSIQELQDDVPRVFRTEVLNVNKLPFPSRHLIEMNTYTRKLSGIRATMVMGSRGSPFGPTWICSKYKTFSIRRVMNEIETIINIYGIRNFYFGDTCFSYNPVRALDIAREMHQKELHFGFSDAIFSVDIKLYNELEKLGAREVLLNPMGDTDKFRIKEMQHKISVDTKLRVMVHKDTKYIERKEGTTSKEELENGKTDQPKPEADCVLP